MNPRNTTPLALFALSASVIHSQTIRQQVTVTADAPTPLAVPVSQSTLSNIEPGTPGRGLLDAIVSTPGWLFEANAVPHPRGSEYQTTFIIDGVPRTENLSPSFSAPPEGNEFASAEVLTAGYPAEYGRNLGGVVRLEPARPQGFAATGMENGSFHTLEGTLQAGYGGLGGEFESFITHRFLDPSTTKNFTNLGASQNFRIRDQVGPYLQLSFDENTLHHDVPNELVQQSAGQLQTVHSSSEGGSAILTRTGGNVTYQGVAAFRHENFRLDSNAFSTPILFGQNRGFNEGYFRFSMAGSGLHQTWRLGADSFVRQIHEQDAYLITNPTQFDEETRPVFAFHQSKGDFEPALYAEDTLTLGPWTVQAGIRFDAYHFVVGDHALSPRVTVIRNLGQRVAVHGSYDRVFETPSLENLLVASAPTSAAIEPGSQQLPVRPGYANFYELGFTSTPLRRLALGGNVFLRKWTSFEDDDTILNTGVSVPFTDRTANVHGEEVSVALTEVRGFDVHLTYSNQVAIATGPITGGLLIGDEGAVPPRFPVSQDQRNTVRSRIGYTHAAFHAAVATKYNSGLPVNLSNGDSTATLSAEFGPTVVSKVNFDRGRVSPWSTTDFSTGLHLGRHFAIDGRVGNIGNGTHVINFASLFSGTAIASPRSYSGRVAVSW